MNQILAALIFFTRLPFWKIKEVPQEDVYKRQGPQIALCYACAYPLGVVGIIGSIIAIRYIFRVNMAKEEESLKIQSGDSHHKPHMMSLEVRNESISGKTLIEIKNFLGRKFVCSRIRHDGHVSIPDHETVFNIGDQLFIVCSEEDAPAILVFIGKEAVSYTHLQR